MPPGEYRVEWQGTGASVEASILQAGKVLASTPATLFIEKTNLNGAFETKEGVNNSHILQAIDWSDRSLHFDQGNASSTNKGS